MSKEGEITNSSSVLNTLWAERVMTEMPPERTTFLKKIVVSIDLSNCSSNLLFEVAIQEIMMGVCVSFVVSQTEFITPGVPPETLLDAFQLDSSKQFASGLSCYRENPPSCFNSF